MNMYLYIHEGKGTMTARTRHLVVLCVACARRSTNVVHMHALITSSWNSLRTTFCDVTQRCAICMFFWAAPRVEGSVG